MKTTIFKKVLSLFILLSFIFIFIGCDLGKFGLNLSGDDDDNKQNQPVDEVKADVTKELFEYYYSKLSSSPYSFNLWYSLYQEQNISFVLKDNVIYFVDTSTNNEYVYFNLNDLDNNPLHLTIINSNNTVYVKDGNNNIFTLFTYEIVNVSKEYHVQFFDEGTMLKEITVNANTTLSSAFSKASVSSTLTKEGFQLVGWYVDRAGRVLSNSEISGYIITGDTKVYAEWQEGEPVDENFVIVSISDGFGNQVTVEVEKGTSLAKVLQNNGFDLSPTHAGYRFDFWKVGDTYVESSRANRYYINSNTFILAQWFDPSGGVKINVHYYDGITDFTVEFPIDTAINDFFNQYNIPSQDIKNNPNYKGVLVNGKEIYPYGYTDFILFEDCEITILWKNNNNNDNFIVVIDDNFGNTIQLDYQSPVKASDALKRNGFDVSISHEGYNFLGWEIDGQLVRTSDLYGYELSRGNSSVEYVVHRITAKWEKIVSNQEDVSVLVSPTILNEGTYNVLLTNDYLVFNKTSSGNDWDCIIFPFKENVDYNAYNKLYIRFKGTAGERVLFKINDRYETYVDCTGVEQDIYLNINFEFDYSRYALVVFAKPGGSGSSGNCYIYQMNLTNKEQLSEYTDLSSFNYTLNHSNKTIKINGYKNTIPDDFFDIVFRDSYEINGEEYVITEIGDFAFNIWQLRSVHLPVTLKKINTYAFNGCQNLTEVDIPSSVEEIGYNAFGSTGIRDLYIPASVKIIGGYLFANCNDLEYVQVDKNNKVYDSRDECNAIIETETNKLICGTKNTVIPSSIRIIATDAFYDCSVRSIGIPEGVEILEEAAIRFCSQLEYVYIPSTVTFIGVNLFVFCDSLRLVEVSPDNPIYDSRDNCSAIIETATNKLICGTNYTKIPTSVTSIGECAFNSRSLITSLDLHEGITSVGLNAFQGLTSLKTISIPSTLTEIGFGAFMECYSLRKITVSADNPRYYSTNNVLMEKKTETLIISNEDGTLPLQTKIIGHYAFFEHSSLQNFVISPNVTKIDHAAFMCCGYLESIVIPKSVTYMDSQVFDNCFNLRYVYYTGTQEEWNAIHIDNSNEILQNVNIVFNYSYEYNSGSNTNNTNGSFNIECKDISIWADYSRYVYLLSEYQSATYWYRLFVKRASDNYFIVTEIANSGESVKSDDFDYMILVHNDNKESYNAITSLGIQKGEYLLFEVDPDILGSEAFTNPIKVTIVKSVVNNDPTRNYYYVDDNFANEIEGNNISISSDSPYFGQSLVYKVNAFATINEALAVIQDGDVIYIGAGTYNENLIINHTVTFLGANYGQEGYKNRTAEAILEGSILVGADNVGFEGFTIRCGIKLAKEEINSFDYCNNILDISDSSTYYLTYEYDYQTKINDLVITGNYCSNAKSYFFFKLAVVNNLLFLDNRFVPNENGYVYDYLCIDKYIIGDVTINNNHFEKCIQGAIRILGVGALNMEIRDNTFIDVASTCIDTRIMYDEVAGPVFIDIIHNTFDQSGYSWRCIRTRNTNYGDNTLDVQVHYNAFLNGCYTEVNGVKTYANNPNGNDVIYNMDNNYFAEVPASDVSNDNFAGTASSWSNCYDSVEDLERAYAALNN